MIVGVHPLAGFDKLLHYRVPERLRGELGLGSLVRVPVLRALRLGVVGEVSPPSAPTALTHWSPPDFPLAKLKSVAEVVYPFPALSPELLKLARWMSRYYAAPLDGIIETMIPVAVRNGASIKEEVLLRAVSEEERASDVPPSIADGSAAKAVLRTSSGGTPNKKALRAAPKQAQVYEFLARQSHPQPKRFVLERLGVTAAVVAALVKRGLVREERRRVVRHAYADDWASGEVAAAQPPVLNAEQAAAAAAIEEKCAPRGSSSGNVRDDQHGNGGGGDRGGSAGGFGVSLLHGVTGSGKTEVYLHAIDRALKAGGGVIFLVPEVALTPQTVARLRARLESIAPGHACVVWHSHLSEGERLDGWLALASGEARVVVGARSAVFAPVQNLRLIVVDEEHEPAYKQDESPRYHGRDVAVYRAHLAGAHCVLGSATPSLESYANVQAGKYALLELKQRVDDRKLPFIDVVDMRVEIMRSRGLTILSQRLVRAMQDRFEKREQVILFINRRGYSSSMICQDCGHVEECDHCSIAMTYHRTDETLRCHLCGAGRPAPARCPKCGSPKIRWRGLGTQRVEEAVRRVLPQARIERMDTDTMGRKNRFREVLGDFRAGRIDVLVGTQMIAKGLDFPNVTLVGLIDADISLHIPDFRASERTFQLLVQVAGRAGRGDLAGEVIVQTFTPQAEPIQFSRHADFAGFSEAELKLRRDFKYPPYRHLIKHLFRGPNPEKLQFYAEQWAKRVEAVLGGAVELRGPSPSPIEKVKDHYRWQLWYFTENVSKTVPKLVALQREFPWADDVSQVLDVDPVSLG